MKKLKRLVGIILLLAIVTSVFSGSALAASGSRYFLVADDVTNSGMTQVNTICSNLTSLGYPNTYTYLPLPTTLYSNLPNYYVAVVHGHGGPGVIACKQSNGSSQNLYSAGTNAQVSFSNYVSGALNSVKLTLFITCHSAMGPSNSTSNGFVATAYNKGASVSIGFKDDVTAGEWWANYFVNSLSFYSIDSAAYLADANFAYYFPSVSGSPSSPDNANNQYILGSKYSFIWNL